MHRLFAILLSGCLLPVVLPGQEPAGALADAIQALLERSDFKWRLQMEQDNWHGQSMGFEGRTGSNGYTVVERAGAHSGRLGSSSDLPARVVFHGLLGVAEHAGQWLRPSQVMAQSTPGMGLAGRLLNLNPHQRMREAFDLPRPELILPELGSRLYDLNREGEMITGRLDGRTVVDLMNRGIVRAQVTHETVPASRLPQWLPGDEYAGGEGEAVFWVRDGRLLKYEIRISARPKPGAPPLVLRQVEIVTTLGDPGADEPVVPEAARAVLARLR